VLQALLSAGYSVFAYSMPRPTPGPCGDNGDHNAMFTSYSNVAMGYFLQPSVEAMNYWDTHTLSGAAGKAFTDYSWVGLSGGAWTATIMAALDPRVKISVPVSGSIPGAFWQAGCNKTCAGDDEQFWDAFYTFAGYADLYVMGAYGQGRKQLQINNYQDNCCFGAAQYGSWGMANTYTPKTYVQYIAANTTAIQNLNLGTGWSSTSYSNMIDYGPQAGNGTTVPPTGTGVPNGATEHQISAWAQGQIMTALAVVSPVGARIARFSTDLLRQ
jgi:hypothetical protein